MPCSFSEPLHYLSMSHEDAIKEYSSILSEHVALGFSQSTDVMKLLLSDLGKDAFVPTDWTGIKGIPLIYLKTREGLPHRFKPAPRNINPKLYENAKKEYERLSTYFYVRSDSPICSPLVIAYKAGPPGLRFAGDYSVIINKFMETGHFPIPNVKHALGKISKYKIFLDLDLTNGFHQLKLHEDTSRLLSVQTPWDTVRPLFLPEGVPQGSGLLQEAMITIFGE